MSLLDLLFTSPMTCPKCDGEGQVIVTSLSAGKPLKTRKCTGCRGKGYLKRR